MGTLLLGRAAASTIVCDCASHRANGAGDGSDQEAHGSRGRIEQKDRRHEDQAAEGEKSTVQPAKWVDDGTKEARWKNAEWQQVAKDLGRKVSSAR